MSTTPTTAERHAEPAADRARPRAARRSRRRSAPRRRPRTTRPPSSGKAGSRFTPPRTRLRTPTTSATAPMTCAGHAPPTHRRRAAASEQRATEGEADAAGPASGDDVSSRGDRVSRPSESPRRRRSRRRPDGPAHPPRRAAIAWPSSWARADSRNAHGDDAPDEPAHRRVLSGAQRPDLRRDGHRDDRQDDRPRDVDPDLEAEQPGDRQGAHSSGRAASGRIGGGVRVRRGSASRSSPAPARRRRRRGHDDGDDPERDRRLLPEREREELDEPLGGRIEGVGAAGEEQLVEDLEQLVEGDDGDAADQQEPR